MKNVLYIATVADKRNRLDGETGKNRVLKEYLNEINDINVKTIDTDNWQKHILKLVFLILYNYFKSDIIIVSAADRGAHIILDFFRKIKSKKDIYYFVIGGSLAKSIQDKKWNLDCYRKVKCIYVEVNILKNDLNKLGIDNIEILYNFRKIKKFKNKYKKSKKVRFIYYGRVIKEKGIEEAIKLVNRLNKENIDCSLDIYGQCKIEYLNKIKKLFSKNIKYNGEIKPDGKTEYEILSQYDIFIFPTVYSGESLSGALVDCYVAGLAVIASNWKYAHECIKDGENGYIFEYQNYEDMYDKTIKLLKSGKLMKFKLKSQDLSEQYYVDKVLSKFKEEILKRI